MPPGVGMEGEKTAGAVRGLGDVGVRLWLTPITGLIHSDCNGSSHDEEHLAAAVLLRERSRTWRGLLPSSPASSQFKALANIEPRLTRGRKVNV